MANLRTMQPIFTATIRSSRPSTTRYICPPCLQQRQQTIQRRSASTSIKKEIPVPQPTPFVPDVQTFLMLIGRDLKSQASKIPSWKALFTYTSEQFKDAGIEPARTRRYLLGWRDKFRRGIYGPGGDFTFVKDGTAHLRVVEVPALAQKTKSTSQGNAIERISADRTPGMTKLLLNVPEGSTTYQLQGGIKSTADLKKPKGFKLRDGNVICGPYALPVKDTNGAGAVVKAVEGMWEYRLGQKVYGGERRRAQTLHKLGVAEHRKAIGTAR